MGLVIINDYKTARKAGKQKIKLIQEGHDKESIYIFFEPWNKKPYIVCID